VEPEVRYAKSGDVNIAYQVTGEGPFDVVFVPGFVTHLEIEGSMPFAPVVGWALSRDVLVTRRSEGRDGAVPQARWLGYPRSGERTYRGRR
jgi:hypothetical protein